MTRYFYDCEFLEDGQTIDLISIGIVADDGREHYAVNSDAPWERVKSNDWLARNVLPSLPITGRFAMDAYLKSSPRVYPRPSLVAVDVDRTDTRVRPRWVIVNEVREFLLAAPEVELWAWYGAYDHVALAQLWGPMVRLPDGIPMYTRDLQQEADRQKVDLDGAVPVVGTAHNALDDARRAKAMWEHLQGVREFAFTPSSLSVERLSAHLDKEHGRD